MKVTRALVSLLVVSPTIVLASTLNLAVFKSPNCGCCVKWVNSFPDNFNSKSFHQYDLSLVKEKLGVPISARSCHTAITKDGLFFEGHIPTKLIQQYVNGKRHKNGIGLAVPNMPVGSPGMEMGERFDSYVVYEILSTGEKAVYATVDDKSQQDLLML